MTGPALNSDLAALRSYVTAETGAQRQAESTVRLQVTHSNLRAKFMEIRLDMHMTIDAVKRKLCFHSGTAPSAMALELRDERSAFVARLDDDGRKLGFYSPRDGWTLHVEDRDPLSASANGWLEDTSKVEKYVMSDEAYAARDNTYRKYKEARLAEDPTWTLAGEMAARRAKAAGGGAPPARAAPPKAEDDGFQAAEAAAVPVGARVEVEGGRRGVARWVGTAAAGLPKGWWVGVQYDEPVGRGDGATPSGARYFSCAQGYGAYVRPALVRAGDFPPFDEDLGFSDGDEI